MIYFAIFIGCWALLAILALGGFVIMNRNQGLRSVITAELWEAEIWSRDVRVIVECEYEISPRMASQILAGIYTTIADLRNVKVRQV